MSSRLVRPSTKPVISHDPPPRRDSITAIGVGVRRPSRRRSHPRSKLRRAREGRNTAASRRHPVSGRNRFATNGTRPAGVESSALRTRLLAPALRISPPSKDSPPLTSAARTGFHDSSESHTSDGTPVGGETGRARRVSDTGRSPVSDSAPSRWRLCSLPAPLRSRLCSARSRLCRGSQAGGARSDPIAEETGRGGASRISHAVQPPPSSRLLIGRRLRDPDGADDELSPRPTLFVHGDSHQAVERLE